MIIKDGRRVISPREEKSIARHLRILSRKMQDDAEKAEIERARVTLIALIEKKAANHKEDA